MDVDVDVDDKKYLFQRSELTREEARLDLFEELFDLYSQALLERIGLRRGGRFLEVAAGRGSIACFLLARCGANGHVVATDIDMRWLEQLAHPNLTVKRHNLLLDDLASLGTFDLVHTRMLLCHLGADADMALQRLASLVAPAGHLVVEDVLWDNRYDPAHPDATQLHDEDDDFDRAALEYGLDMHVALTFPRRMGELGLVDVGNEIVGGVRRGGDAFSQLLVASIDASNEELTYDEPVHVLGDPSLWYVPWHRIAIWGTRPPSADMADQRQGR